MELGTLLSARGPPRAIHTGGGRTDGQTDGQTDKLQLIFLLLPPLLLLFWPLLFARFALICDECNRDSGKELLSSNNKARCWWWWCVWEAAGSWGEESDC